MGKEWYWGGSKSSNSKRVGEKCSNATTSATPTGCMSNVFQFFDFHHFQFPLNQHQSSFKHRNSFDLPEDHTVLKGVEAPRNSLELEEIPMSSISLKEEEENLNIPMGIQIKTSTGDAGSRNGSATNDSSSEISSSPGAKTPNLVARLMGLDLLPESHSPSFSSFRESPHLAAKSNLHHHFRPRQQPRHGKPISHRNSIDVDITGTRSLPETPRISSARRSDVDHHRLSLQIHKENIGAGEELDFSRFSYVRRKELKQEDEYRSPSHYARQIVKQVKESVSRKVGLDLTNTLKTRERDEIVSLLKAKKSSRVLSKVVDQSSPGKHSTPSCSPRLSRFLEPKQKTVLTTTSYTNNKENLNIPHQPRKSSSSPPSLQVNTIQPQPIKVLSSKSKLQPVQEQEHNRHIHEQRPAKKCKKATAGERFSPRLKKPPQTTDIIRNKQEEPFIRSSSASNRANSPDKKCKKTPLLNDLLNITVPTLLPVKKDPSPPGTKLPQKQVLNAQSSKRSSQLSSNSSQTHKQKATSMLDARGNIDDRPNGVATTTTKGGAEYEYVARILERTGIDKDTPVSFTKWFSPSHPLDPSIFHHLENINPIISSSDEAILTSPLIQHCNRKLLFQLVDEILVDFLKPYINMKPWVSSHNDVIGREYGHMQGSELVDTLCKQIKSYPCADCRVLEDIDTLIEKDLPQMKVQKVIAFEDEGEGLVIEIEKDILDTLIHETAVEFGVGMWR